MITEKSQYAAQAPIRRSSSHPAQAWAAVTPKLINIAGQYAVGQAMFDRERQAHGHAVGLCPSPLVARLADAAGFQWIARTVACDPAAPPPAAPAADEGQDGLRIAAGKMPVDVPPTELRLGDQVQAGGRLVAFTHLRYRQGRHPPRDLRGRAPGCRAAQGARLPPRHRLTVALRAVVESPLVEEIRTSDGDLTGLRRAGHSADEGATARRQTVASRVTWKAGSVLAVCPRKVIRPM
ncbi:hypothetical protein K7B10_00475 [Streptomyces flavotricini]|uniref:Uncharacterized protein n=1 Tax=Streptomyces flavotricini TaxID=66888 RepID=A0ABS8DX90_9ACTN|nr:hypothetical protein [Streptomyces flavotricini]MCC0093302.1 hypothetical protein [Streptomyces flavotricini]